MLTAFANLSTPTRWSCTAQHTGRVVTVSDDTIFDESVYNYTRDCPYPRERITTPIAHQQDARATWRPR